MECVRTHSRKVSGKITRAHVANKPAVASEPLGQQPDQWHDPLIPARGTIANPGPFAFAEQPVEAANDCIRISKHRQTEPYTANHYRSRDLIIVKGEQLTPTPATALAAAMFVVPAAADVAE